ncbi:MAG: hypothetical protein JWQ73_2318 [Variovorax sp.]|nr:hypothetical protein [Variovorax sp.]
MPIHGLESTRRDGGSALAAFCPWPGLVALGSGKSKAYVFTAAMPAGMIVFEWIMRRTSLLADSVN